VRPPPRLSAGWPAPSPRHQLSRGVSRGPDDLSQPRRRTDRPRLVRLADPPRSIDTDALERRPWGWGWGWVLPE
jgi:hypothetical protein